MGMGWGWGWVGIAGCPCYLFCPCDECCDSWFVILFLYGRLCLLFSVAILIVLQLHLIIVHDLLFNVDFSFYFCHVALPCTIIVISVM